MDKDMEKEVKKEVDTPEKNVKLEDKVVDIFKIILGYNWHMMGTKKDF